MSNKKNTSNEIKEGRGLYHEMKNATVTAKTYRTEDIEEWIPKFAKWLENLKESDHEI